MKKQLKLILLCAVAAAALIAAAAGGAAKKLDIVATDSVAAFGEILEALPDGAITDGREGRGSGEAVSWTLAAPDGTARFTWGRNGVRLTLDAKPFLAAGLDASKLPPTHTLAAGEIAITMNWASGPSAGDFSTPLAAYAAIVESHRDHINYHSFLDHYGVKAGGGNMFEWAKNTTTNDYDNTVQDKDIVFALNPAPFAAAGTDPATIPGWIHAEVPVMSGGSVVTEWNLLKPFDLQ